MKLYFAPMEGITGYVYRNAFNTVFKYNIDKYFSPFISPGVNQPLTPKELRDIHPKNNKGMYLVPQILANNADDFLLATKYIKELGYNEVNLNVGCPSGTVVAKKKGSGLLANTHMLERMLTKIYETTDMKVSVKTRIGINSSDEFPEIMEIYNEFPMEELIIHPRVRADFYKNKPDLNAFKMAVEESKNILCYNGDIVTKDDYNKICMEFKGIEAVMVGRGFLLNPALGADMLGEKRPEISKIKEFHDTLLNGYEEVMSGERPVLFKMKELWHYMINAFDNGEKYGKKIRKAEKLSAYKEVVERLFGEC